MRGEGLIYAVDIRRSDRHDGEMSRYRYIESLFLSAKPPRAGSTSWYDACDLLTTAIKERLRERFGRGFQVEVYGDEVGLILRVRGDGYGVGPWSVDRTLDPHEPLEVQVDRVLPAIEESVADKYCRE